LDRKKTNSAKVFFKKTQIVLGATPYPLTSPHSTIPTKPKHQTQDTQPTKKPRPIKPALMTMKEKNRLNHKGHRGSQRTQKRFTQKAENLNRKPKSHN
jgi:hypothetical protein